jgi:hypothetical protein
MAELENGILSVQSLYVRKELHDTELVACQDLWAGNLYYFVHLCVRTCVCACVCVCVFVCNTRIHTHKHVRASEGESVRVNASE